jgi:hypothetical protein
MDLASGSHLPQPVCRTITKPGRMANIGRHPLAKGVIRFQEAGRVCHEKCFLAHHMVHSKMETREVVIVDACFKFIHGSLKAGG